MAQGPARHAASHEAPRTSQGAPEATGTDLPKTDRPIPDKVFSPIAAWALSLGCVVGWGSFIMPANTFLPVAGPLGTAIALTVGAVVMLAIAANYGFMAKRCPGPGGVYSYARDTFGPNQAFVCSWCLVLAYGSAMIANATAIALVVRATFGGVLQFGPHYSVAGYDVFIGEVLLGIAAIVAFGAICIKGARLTGIIQTVLAVCLTVGVLAIAVLVLSNPDVSLGSLKPLFNPSVPSHIGTLMVMAFVPWAYIGFEAVSQASEECNFPPGRFALVMVVSIVFGLVMYLVLSTATALVVPEGYPDWVAYIADLPNLAGVSAIPSFHVGYQLAGRAGLALFGVTALCAVLSGVVGFYVAASRLIYAMALDGALPRRFSRLHERYHTPVVATLAIMVVTLIVPFFGRNVLNWIVDLMSLGALIAYAYTSVAVFVRANRENRRFMTLVGAFGLLLSCLLILLLIIPLPGADNSLSRESYVILFAWVALGVNFYTPTVSR